MQQVAYQTDAPITAQSLAQAPIPQEDIERKQEMREAWKSYHGKFKQPLKIAKDQPNDNVISNRCAPVVEKGASFLFGQVLKIEGQDKDFIEGLWGNDDKRMTRLSKFALNGGVCGQIFAKLIPARPNMRYPRIVTLDPQLIRIVTAPDDCELHLAYIIEYPGSGDLQKRQIITRIDPEGDAAIVGEFDLDDTWTIVDYVRRGQVGRWMQVGIPEQWPYPFAPIFTSQNLPHPNEPWGISDLTPDLIQMNNVLNFIQSNTARVLKFHGHPKTWGKGFKASQLTVGIDDVLIIEAMDGTLQNLEMHSDLQSALHMIALLMANMDERSRVPAVALGRETALPKGNISGVALQLLFQPLIEKTIQKQRLYGEFIRDVTRAGLVLSGRIPIESYEDYEVGIHWQDLLPMDDLLAAQVALILEQLGVSLDTILLRLGFSPEDEARKKAIEDKAKLDAYSKGAGLMPMQQQQVPGQPAQGSPFIGGSGGQQGQ
jgi:hypothetical protein